MGSIKFPHASGNGMSIAAPATNPASDLELKLPATVGTAGQVLKNSSTAGTLEFGDGLPTGLAYASSTLTVTGHVKQDGGFGIMEPCFNATMGDDVACFDQTWTKNDRWQNEGTGMNPGWDSTNDKFTVPTGGAGHYLFIWTIQLGDGHQNHLDEEEILDTILRKNGTDIGKSKNRSPGTVNDWFHVTGSYCCELADADYIEMYHWHNEGGRLDIDDASCSFMGFRLAEGD